MILAIGQRMFLKTVVIISFSFSYGTISCQSFTETNDKKQLEEKVDAYVHPYLSTADFSGSILIAKSGEVLLSKSYGFANREKQIPNTQQTKFHLASVSKPFTTAAIMLLAEQGLLKVADPVTKFIPDYRNGDKITVHHLMTHSSGIPEIQGHSFLGSLFRRSHTPESLVDQFKNKDLIFEPGEWYHYTTQTTICLPILWNEFPAKILGHS